MSASRPDRTARVVAGGLVAAIALTVGCSGSSASAPSGTTRPERGPSSSGTSSAPATDELANPATATTDAPLGPDGTVPQARHGSAPAVAVPPSYASPEQLHALGIDPHQYALLGTGGIGAMRFGEAEQAATAVLAESASGVLHRRQATCEGSTFDVLEFDDLVTVYDLSSPDAPFAGYRFRKDRGGPAPLTTGAAVHLGSTVRDLRAAAGDAIVITAAASYSNPVDPTRARVHSVAILGGTAPDRPTGSDRQAPIRALLSGGGDDDVVVALDAGQTCAVDTPS